jgi:hypothetical protein
MAGTRMYRLAEYKLNASSIVSFELNVKVKITNITPCAIAIIVKPIAGINFFSSANFIPIDVEPKMINAVWIRPNMIIHGDTTGGFIEKSTGKKRDMI